jgi:murein DD-endopeptidase MepM/ murein hydrolase activator NlpD
MRLVRATYIATAATLLFAVAAAGATAQEFSTAPDTVEQGAPAVFVIDWPTETKGAGGEGSVGASAGGLSGGEVGREAFLTLESDSEGRVLTSRCFPMDDDRWVCLTGISSTLEPGAYQVSVILASGSGTVELARPLDVVKRDFARETIPLNRSLTAVRAEPNERRAEEAERMWELVSRFDPRSVYHSGPFLLPVTGGRRTSHFGDRRTYRYVDGASANAVHWGIDIAAPTGTPVRAGGAGRVVMVADRVISGNTVVIEHLPGVYGLHYHLDETRVEAGDTVSAADIVGTVGATGLATGPHLHWEVRVSRVPVEPEVLLSAGLIDIDAISENIMDADGTPQ